MAINTIRYKKRQQEEEWIQTFLERAAYGTLAMTLADGQPIVNMNIFAYDRDANAIYFHTAHQGQTHGYVTLTSIPPFPDDKRYDAQAVRQYRKSIADNDGFGLSFFSPIKTRQVYLIEDAIPYIRLTLENGIVAETIIYVTQQPSPLGVVQYWRFSEPGSHDGVTADVDVTEESTVKFFFVADAIKSNAIPDKEQFVYPYGIQSVIGLGSAFISNSSFVALYFCKQALSKERAKTFAEKANFLATLLATYDSPNRLWAK